MYVVEGVDSVKLASKLNSACVNAGRVSLDIFLQVNTSSEDSKSGCDPRFAKELAGHILKECPRLQLKGLMTIGKYGDTSPVYFQVSLFIIMLL